MKRLYYASGSVLTGDRMADAIVRYAAAFRGRERADTIDIPIVLGNGQPARAQLLISSSSQFAVIPEPELPNGPEDESTIEELAKKARLLSRPRPQASEENTDFSVVEGDEFG